MNRHILQGLFNGDIIPWERKEPRSEELLEAVRKIEEEEQYFISKMSPDDCKRFQQLSKLYSRVSSAGEEGLFSYSFTLGLLLALDVAEQATLFLSNQER
ncbi:MAG: hypothetical protein RR415_11255 [Ruthenibacterium sp.]